MQKSCVNETSDKSYLKRINKYSKSSGNHIGEICNYCQQPKRQFGSGKNMMIICGCTGRQIYTKSGIPVKKQLKFK